MRTKGDFSKKLFYGTVTICIMFLFCSSVLAQLANSPWPMFNHDPQHTGLSPYVGPDEPFVSWKYRVGTWLQSSSAIDSEGNIYFGTANYRLYALSSVGEWLWHYRTKSFVPSSPAVGVDGTIYVGSIDGSLYAINPDGKVKWEYKTGGPINKDPCVAPDGTIYIGSDDDKLHAVNSDGSPKWTFLTGGDVGSSPALDRNGTIYFGSNDRNLYALYPDGSLKWVKYLGEAIRSAPAIDPSGIIYVGCNNWNLYALYPDGTIKWTFPTGNQIPGSPSFDDAGNIYVGSHDTYLYSIRPNGSLRWKFKTGDVIWDSSPTIDAAGTVYVGSHDDAMYAINSDGSLKWKFQTGGDVGVSAVLDENGRVYFGSKDGYFYAIGPPLPDDGGDLAIGWISRTPQIDYIRDSQHPDVEGWPVTGERVTWSAHIKSWSDVNRKAVGYAWYLNGVKVASDSIDIPANSYVTVDYAWDWTFDRHELTLVLDPANEFNEEAESNNSLTIYTDALSAAFYVERSVYNHFRTHQGELDVGSTCWEDWAQRQVKQWNDMCAAAIYPDTPNGVRDRLRLDNIIIVDDGALPLSEDGSPVYCPAQEDKSVDIQRGFPTTLLDGDSYKDYVTVSEDNPFYVDGALLHEIGQTRYLIDVYGFNVSENGDGSTVALQENGKLVAGSDYMPIDAAGYVYQIPQDGLMNNNSTKIDPYSALALNQIAGFRATHGNYYTPDNMGAFLNDLPEQNSLILKNEAGGILPHAAVSIYQATEKSGVWYGKYFDETPDLQFTADVSGRVVLGPCPFSEDGLIHHGYGLANGAILLKIEHENQKGYTFVDVTPFNMAYWRGQTSENEMDIFVSLVDAEQDTSLTWQCQLEVRDASDETISLAFGQAPSATDRIDEHLGEAELPPPPPSDLFDARFELPLQQSSLKDFRADEQELLCWQLDLQPGSVVEPLLLSWNFVEHPEYSLFLNDGMGGALFSINMKNQSSFMLPNLNITSLQIEMTREIQRRIQMASGWNLISVPVLSPDMNVSALYPTAVSDAFAFDDGYYKVNELMNGLGYWLKFAAPHTDTLRGEEARPQEIAVKIGWNIIGPFESDGAVSRIVSEPSGLVISDFFTFENGYKVVEYLSVGKGYWVKTHADGVLYFSDTTLSKNRPSQLAQRQDLPQLFVVDAQGQTGTIYFSTDNHLIASSCLPPQPPHDVFDVRFSTDRTIENPDRLLQLNIQAAHYPLTLKMAHCEDFSLSIKDASHAGIIDARLDQGGEVLITQPLEKLLLCKEPNDVVPSEFKLCQNYPNPFNPTTTIEFHLPAAAHATITIYNLAGEKVRTAASGQFEAGVHKVEIRAGALASGVYYYVLRAGRFEDVKKMLVLK